MIERDCANSCALNHVMVPDSVTGLDVCCSNATAVQNLTGGIVCCPVFRFLFLSYAIFRPIESMYAEFAEVTINAALQSVKMEDLVLHQILANV